jgi:hypothetical protein
MKASSCNAREKPNAPLLEYEESPNYLLPLEVCGRGMAGNDDRMDMPKRWKRNTVERREGAKGIK